MKRHVFQDAEVYVAGLAEARRVSHLSVSKRFKGGDAAQTQAEQLQISGNNRKKIHFAFRFLLRPDAMRLVHVWSILEQNDTGDERKHYFVSFLCRSQQRNDTLQNKQ